VTRRGWLLFGTLSVIWGVPYLFIKIAVEHLSPPFVVWTRVALAAAALLPLTAVRGWLRPLLPHWHWMAAFAVVEIAVPWALLGYAEQRISSSLTGLLVAAVPLMGALLGWWLRLDDRLDGRRFAGLLVGLAGVAALVGIDIRGGDLVAVAAVLVTAFCYALGPVIVAARLAGLPSLAVVAVSFGLNAVWYAPFGWVTRPTGADGRTALGDVPAAAWWAIVVLGLLCSALAFLVFFALVADIGPSRATIITYVNPAVAVALGVAVLGEPVTVGILVGFPLVLVGSWLATGRSAPA
jgi:drug/metabolite transporter (DMT)-like permease